VPGEYCARSSAASSSLRATPNRPRVEQQHHLGHHLPFSLYDLRNLFQVNVEEGRHLWAMVYLLHKPTSAATGARKPRSCSPGTAAMQDNPRILQHLQRAGAGLAVASSCSPTSPTATASTSSAHFAESGLRSAGALLTSFMLTEEAHHMFVGETGVRTRGQARAAP
jgi:benzoyl-CoA 2,3-epoxidase subunit B